jgi:signal transduction histidine kinase
MRMIGTLLDLSKADEGRLVPAKTAVALAPLFAEVGEAMRVRAQASNVQLSVTTDVETVHADLDLLRRVLENLVDNAIRHAPEETSVIVTATHRDGAVELRIRDAGTGIAPELHEHLFDRFVQGNRPRGGHGLGLAFCKLAVEAHGGRIWIERADPGTIFCLQVPDVRA